MSEHDKNLPAAPEVSIDDTTNATTNKISIPIYDRHNEERKEQEYKTVLSELTPKQKKLFLRLATEINTEDNLDNIESVKRQILTGFYVSEKILRARSEIYSSD